MSDLTVTSYTSSGTGVRSVDFTNGNIIVSNNAGGTLVNMATVTNFTNLTTNPTTNPNGFVITNNSANATTITIGLFSEANSCNFKFNIGSYALTLQANGVLRNLVFESPFTGSIAAISALTIYGSLVLISGMAALPAGLNSWSFAATSSQTITSAGKALDFPLIFNGVGGTWALQDNLTTGATRTVTLTNGTINLGIRTLTIGLFSSSNTNTRSIVWGTGGKIVLNYTATASNTIWNTSPVTGLTVGGAGDPLVEVTGGGNATFVKTITAGALSEGNSISFSLIETTGAHSITFGTSSIRNLTLNGTQTLTNAVITIYGNYSYIGSGTTLSSGTNAWTFASTNASARTIDPNNVNHPFPFIFNGIGGTWTLQNNLSITNGQNITMTNGTIDFNSKTVSATSIVQSTAGSNVTIKSLVSTSPISQSNGTLTLGANNTCGSYGMSAGTLVFDVYALTCTTLTWSGAGAKTFNFGTSGKFVVNNSTGGTIITGTASGLTVSGTNPLIECTGGGTSITKTIGTGSMTEATSIGLSLLDTSSTVTYDITGSSPNAVRNLRLSGTQIITNRALTIFGSYTYEGSGTVFSGGASAWTFASTNASARTLTSNGASHNFPWVFNGVGGTWSLADAATVNSTNSTTLTNGTLDLNGFTFSTGSFTTAAGTKTLLFDGGTLAISGSGATAFNPAVTAGLTLSAGTANGTISMTSGTAKTFVGAGLTYPATLNQGGTGDLTVTGTNQFGDLSASITSTANANILFTSGTTTTFPSFTLTGNATYKPALRSVTTASAYTLNYTGSTYVSVDYIDARDAIFSRTGWNNGTDYIRWYVGANSINSGNNRGALFISSSPSTDKVYLIETGISWDTPSDFNTSNNTIHIYGAGGGGGGGRSQNPSGGGGGGGGGGYTKLTNITLYANTSTGVSIGTGGTAGIATNAGGNGVATFFGTTFANGGIGGSSVVTANVNATGGAGGSGSTYSGGAGGQGASLNSASAGGGGGGGSGGLNGTGAAGGNGFASTTYGLQAGGGGGGSGGGTAGSNGSSGLGGAGGNNYLGAGGAAASTTSGIAGTVGGGGSGSSGNTLASNFGGTGSYGIDIFGGMGGGGGAGGGSARQGTTSGAGGAGLGYGAGGGGGGGSLGVATAGGAGGTGVIIITYYPGTAPEPPVSSGSAFFIMF